MKERERAVGRVLVVDDDADMCDYLATALPLHGFEVESRTQGEQALELLAGREFDVLLTDLNMPGMSGITLCQEALAHGVSAPIVVLTAFGSTDSAYEAIRAGAYDFLTKPVEVEALALVLQRAAAHYHLLQEVERLRAERTAGYGDMVGESPPMRRLFELIDKVARTDSAVLICGETGTGKELVANALHTHGPRAAQGFLALNCAAMPEGLLESELFGHVKGAFSGATADRIGLLREADGGTLFLDEVGDMPLSLQAKLLRVLQDGAVRPVGGQGVHQVDVRVLAATHRDLETAIEAGRFREDLYFRLNVIRLDLPPLRARGQDVLHLAESFVTEQARKLGKRVAGFEHDASAALLAYDWPGNVRELMNCVERAVALTSGPQITTEDLPPKVTDPGSAPGSLHLIPFDRDPEQLPTIEELERRYAEHVLDVVGWNKSLAAKVLGLDRRTLYRKLDRWKLADER